MTAMSVAVVAVLVPLLLYRLVAVLAAGLPDGDVWERDA